MSELSFQRRRCHGERVLELTPVLMQVVALSNEFVTVAAIIGKLPCNLLVLLSELLCDAHRLVLDELDCLGEDNRL